MLGALTLGSSLPQLLTAVGPPAWNSVLAVAALLATLGAAISVLWVRTGPHMRPSPPLHPRYVVAMFTDRRQRLVNLGYLGHMWELYALWAWLPSYIAAAHAAWSPGTDTRWAVGGTAFAVIGPAGAAGCVIGGLLADRHGRALVAMLAMLLSAGCGLVSVIVFGAYPAVLVALLLVWGAAVIADSAQFSAALSEVADQRYVGTALTAQTATGFRIMRAASAHRARGRRRGTRGRPPLPRGEPVTADDHRQRLVLDRAASPPGVDPELRFCWPFGSVDQPSQWPPRSAVPSRRPRKRRATGAGSPL
jgi:hypothetical protein